MRGLSELFRTGEIYECWYRGHAPRSQQSCLHQIWRYNILVLNIGDGYFYPNQSDTPTFFLFSYISLFPEFMSAFNVFIKNKFPPKNPCLGMYRFEFLLGAQIQNSLSGCLQAVVDQVLVLHMVSMSGCVIRNQLGTSGWGLWKRSTGY